MDLQSLIEEGATIIDVRTKMEFLFGHAPGSVNIPLNEVPKRIQEIKDMPQPRIIICQSGNRSGQACRYLQSEGISCTNGGPWTSVANILRKKSA